MQKRTHVEKKKKRKMTKLLVVVVSGRRSALVPVSCHCLCSVFVFAEALLALAALGGPLEYSCNNGEHRLPFRPFQLLSCVLVVFCGIG